MISQRKKMAKKCFEYSIGTFNSSTNEYRYHQIDVFLHGILVNRYCCSTLAYYCFAVVVLIVVFSAYNSLKQNV